MEREKGISRIVIYGIDYQGYEEEEKEKVSGV